MNSNKVIKLVENEAKKRNRKAFYYRDQDNKMWIGQGTGVFRLDIDFILGSNWAEQNMNQIIPRSIDDLKDISLSMLQIKDVRLTYSGEYVTASVFLAKDDYAFVQTRYIEPLEKEEGRWLYKPYGARGKYLYFIDKYDKVKAVICSFEKNHEGFTVFEEQILQLAGMMKGVATNAKHIN